MGDSSLSELFNIAKYAGLTDDPERRRNEHGNPSDWRIEKEFISELPARLWERGKIECGYDGDTGVSPLLRLEMSLRLVFFRH